MSDPDLEMQVTEEVQPDPYQELLKSITDTEGRPKYDSVEKALQGTQHAQQHIGTLEEENEKLRQRMEQMESFFDKYNKQQETQVADPSPTTPTAPEGQQTQLDSDSLFQEFEARLAQKTQAQQKEQNKRQALETVISQYGEKAADVIKEKAADAGMDYRDLLSLAETSPKAFNKIVGIGEKQQSSSSFTRSSVNSAALPGRTQETQPRKNPLLSGRSSDAVDLWNSLGNN